MDWVYKQIIGFLANFFAEMGNMGAEMFEMSWVQSIVVFSRILLGFCMQSASWSRVQNAGWSIRPAGPTSREPP